MSRPPAQRWGHPTREGPYVDSGREQPRGPMTMAHPPSSTHEPRQLPSMGLGYEHPILNTPPGPHLPSLGSFPDQNPDPRDSARGYVSHQPMSQTLPLRMPPHEASTDPRGRSGPCDDTSSVLFSYGRDHDSHRSRPFDLESQYSSSSAAMPSPVYSEKSTSAFANSSTSNRKQQEDPQRQKRRSANYSMPLGFDKLLHHEQESSSLSPAPERPPAPPPRRPFKQSRYHLHIRQQPIAARACGAGDRDRRPVDPPPILQILLTDFNPDSQDDSDILQDPRFTVGCLLFPVSSPSAWPNQADIEADDTPSTPLLSGKAFMSPFFVEADPDPNSAPIHPSSSSLSSLSSSDMTPKPNSPSSTTIPPPHSSSSTTSTSTPSAPSLLAPKSAFLNQSGTFFVFPDLSIRVAGLYRLQFRLMNWGSVEDTGQSMPILAEAWSDPFRVYPAKDFTGMRDSSILAEGLKDLGFVELKTRGKGKGKGRKKG